MYSPIFYEQVYSPPDSRYDSMLVRKAGGSGLSLPAISLGFYHFFGKLDPYEPMRKIVRTAFENGIFHFDLADCYGPPNGEAEYNLGRILKQDFLPYRDELVIATKAGFDIFLGPNGEGGSRKHLTAALDRSLRNLGLDYVDIFYHHIEDPATPLEETADTLASFVRQGKALYIGISNYSQENAGKLIALLKERHCPVRMNQCRYNMLHREIEEELIPKMAQEGVGIAAYTPLAQGLLSDKYISGDYDLASRKDNIDFEMSKEIPEKMRRGLQKLNELAQQRGQTLAQMAVAWCLRRQEITTVLIGCDDPAYIGENLKALKNVRFSQDEEQLIDEIVLDKEAYYGNF